MPLAAQVDYTGARSAGDLGPDITTSSTEKYEDRMANEGAGLYAPRRERLAARDLIRASSFSVDEFLFQGECVVNGELGDYVNDVLNEVLKDAPELRAKLRVYVARDPAVNAFATDQGIIVVNMGLLARVRNEAELAFVLAHEVIHYQRRHSLNSAIEGSRRTSRSYRPDASERSMFSVHEYDRALETEADLEGWKIVMGGAYDQLAMMEMFDILDSAEIALPQLPFEMSFLARLGLAIPDSLLPTEFTAVKIDTTTEEESTHPAVTERRKAIQAMIDASAHGTANVVSAERFQRVRQLAQQEQALLLSRGDQHIAALYRSFLDSRQGTTGLLSDQAATDALFHLALFANDVKVSSDIEHERQGAEERLRLALKNMKPCDLNVIALCWTIDQVARHPQSTYMAITRDRLLQEMVAVYGLHKEGSGLAVNADVAGPVTLGLLGGGEAQHEVLAALEKMDTSKRRPVPGSDDDMTLKELKKASRKRFKAGIDKVVLLDPFAWRMDHRKTTPDDPFKAEDHENSMVYGAQRAAEELDMGVEILHSSVLDRQDAQRLNDLMVLNDWFTRAELANGFVVCPATHDQALEVMDRLGTPYLARTAVFARVTPPTNYLAKYFSICLPMLWPTSIGEVWGPKREMVYLYTVIDVRTGDVVASNLEHLGVMDSAPVVKQLVFDTFRQIHTKP